MAKKSFIVAVLKAAEKHQDNPIIKKLVEGVLTTQHMVHSAANRDAADFSPFAGYRLAAQGNDGYDLMINPDANILSYQIREMHTHVEMAVRVDCLMAALMALGERIEDY